jgi:putative peptidoglycan lipid II flippase
LLASTLGRLYSSTYYALRDTRTPLRFAIVRVVLTTILGYTCAIPLPPLLGIDPRWGVAGLTISAGISSWVEFTLLRRTLNRRIGRTGVPGGYLAKLWMAALIASGIAYAIRHFFSHHSPIILALIVLAPYGLVYFAGTFALGIAEAQALLGRTMRTLGR